MNLATKMLLSSFDLKMVSDINYIKYKSNYLQVCKLLLVIFLNLSCVIFNKIIKKFKLKYLKND